MPRKVSTPEDDLRVIAEARAYTRARKAREAASKKRAHVIKMMTALRAGKKDELAALMKVKPLLSKTKRELRKRCNGADIMFGKQVSMTYVSDIAMDSGDFFYGTQYFDGVHRWQT